MTHLENTSTEKSLPYLEDSNRTNRELFAHYDYEWYLHQQKNHEATKKLRILNKSSFRFSLSLRSMFFITQTVLHHD